MKIALRLQWQLLMAATLWLGSTVGATAETKLVLDADTRWITFFKTDAVEVSIDDQVKDGCWTDARTAKANVELELVRSGYKLAEKGYSIIKVVLEAFGGHPYPGAESCAVLFALASYLQDADKRDIDDNTLYSLHLAQLTRSQVLLTGPVSLINSNITERARSFTVELLVQAAKGKQAILDDLERQPNKATAKIWTDWVNRKAQ